MPLHEMTGERGLEFSAWHRPRSIARYITWIENEQERIQLAKKLSLIDIDVVWVEFGLYSSSQYWVEIEKRGSEPLILVETAKYSETNLNKPVTMIKKLSKRAGLMGLLVLYELSQKENPTCRFKSKDIDFFYVKKVWPEPEKPDVFWKVSPEKYVEWLVKARERELMRLKKAS